MKYGLKDEIDARSVTSIRVERSTTIVSGSETCSRNWRLITKSKVVYSWVNQRFSYLFCFQVVNDIKPVDDLGGRLNGLNNRLSGLVGHRGFVEY